MKTARFHKEHFVWGSLLLLTLLSFFLVDRSNPQSTASHGWLVVLIGAKCWGISHFFMELEEAHLFWKVLVYGLLGMLLLGFCIL